MVSIRNGLATAALSVVGLAVTSHLVWMAKGRKTEGNT